MNTTVSDMEKAVREVLFRNMELSNRVSSPESENKELRERLSRLERPVCPAVTDRVSMEKKCSCKYCTRASFPARVKTGPATGLIFMHLLPV